MTRNLWRTFPYENVEVIVNQEDLSPLLYTTGYVARKLIHKVHYEECKRLFGDKHNPFDLDIDDRGGLIYPSNLLFNSIQCSYSIFNMCVFQFGVFIYQS